VLVLHGGDFFIGDLFFNFYFGVPELQLMQALGFDAMAVGNHEFDLTPAILDTALRNAFPSGGFPLLSANLILDDPGVQGLKDYIFPHTIKQMGNIKVGIFGMTTPETNILSQPWPAEIDENIVEIAAAMVDTLNSYNCDVILCLSHLGLLLETAVASNVPGIDAIIGGHDHYLLETPEAVVTPIGDTTWIVQAKAFYLYMGKLRLVVSSTDARLLDYQAIPLDSSIPEEPTTAATVNTLIAGIEAQIGPVYSQQITYAAEFFEEEADSLLYVGYRDTPIGNLVTDAFRAVTGTDIAIEVCGSTAQPLYQGPIVAADAFRVVGYGFNEENGLGYHLSRFDMLGADLIAGLEFGLSTIEVNDEFFIQSSGLTYVYNAGQPPNSRLVSAHVNNVPLDPTATYSITTNEFVPLFLDFLQISYSNPYTFTGDTTEFQVLTQYISQFDTIRPQPRSRILSPVDEDEPMVPHEFVLDQNFPNPFNPSTTISYALPTQAFVTLKVYNVIGQEVKTLVNRDQQAGSYQVKFDGAGLASGVYFYRLEARPTESGQVGHFVESKRLVLLK
jgi:5'-nucleotidase